MTHTMKYILKRFALLCVATTLCALPAVAQENPHEIGWEAIWETKPWSILTLQDYRDDPEAAMEYLNAFLVWHHRLDNGYYGLPDEQQTPLEDALETAIVAIIAQRGETEASLAPFRISPSFILHSRGVPQGDDAVILQPPLWQIDLQGLGADDRYCVYIDANTGEVLILHGAEVSYG